jgi:hypothetical protein
MRVFENMALNEFIGAIRWAERVECVGKEGMHPGLGWAVLNKTDHLKELEMEFYVLMTVLLGTNLVTNKLDAQFLCIYFTSVHVSSNPVLIIRRINCINTTSGMCHCV